MRKDMSCARVQQYKSSDMGKAERHNERKNESYENLNVERGRIPYNIHFKNPGAKTYLETIRDMEKEGKISTRGLRQDATLLDEIIIDVNTMYFEERGGYGFAKQFYEEAYHFIEQKFGAEYIVSAVMHADEINKAVSEELGKPVYHYHLHAMVIPVVDKEILWSKRCKDPQLRGTVKEVIKQVSHSKKWASNTPMLNENGEPILRQNGKPKYRPSYSLLQDELFSYMQEKGYTDIFRGQLGSTAEHLSSLQYQIEKDKERLADIQNRIEAEQINYEPVHDVYLTTKEIDDAGQKTITGKISMSKDDYTKLTSLAKEGITSRGEINRLKENTMFYQNKYFDSMQSYSKLKERYENLKEICKPFLTALEHFPELVKSFKEKLQVLLDSKTNEKQIFRGTSRNNRER